MSAHHFFVEPDDVDDGIVTITGDEARHAARVVRVRPGEAITVADDTGRFIDAVVTDVADDVRAEVLKDAFVHELRPAITLYQALTKGDKIDDVVQKATEVGVGRIVPFIAHRSVVKWDTGKRTKARDRWHAVARSASKQCRSARLTVVDDVADDVRIALRENGRSLVLHEADEAMPLRRALTEPTIPDTVGIVVGPEGGLTEDEVQTLREGGADVVWLGPRVLRTETAGVVAASIVAFFYGNLG